MKMSFEGDIEEFEALISQPKLMAAIVNLTEKVNMMSKELDDKIAELTLKLANLEQTNAGLVESIRLQGETNAQQASKIADLVTESQHVVTTMNDVSALLAQVKAALDSAGDASGSIAALDTALAKVDGLQTSLTKNISDVNAAQAADAGTLAGLDSALTAEQTAVQTGEDAKTTNQL